MKICLFGLGRIGLPIALVCADSGYRVTGIDVNKELISKLKKGQTVFDEPGLQKLLGKHVNISFFPKHQKENIIDDIKQSEYIVIAVGTGFAKYPEKPKLSTLYSIIGQLLAIGIKDKTLILRVTLPIGTTDEIKSLIEKKTGMVEGVDFFFSFVPERLMEGKAISEERSLPKIIGTYSDTGFEKVQKFFSPIGGDCIRVSNPRTAEFIKLVDNSWRSTRFSFANELAYLAEEVHIDVMEAIESANQGYDRNAIPRPGPVSGYCLGKDPYLLEIAFEDIAQKRGFHSVWYYGRRANDWLIEKIVDETKGKKILVAGLSFKENIDDYRYSHAIDLIRLLIKKGYFVSAYDPFLNMNYYTTLPEDIADDVKAFSDLNKAINSDIDTIIITTRHDELKNADLTSLDESVCIIDLWNLFKGNANVKKKRYKGLGRKKNL